MIFIILFKKITLKNNNNTHTVLFYCLNTNVGTEISGT